MGESDVETGRNVMEQIKKHVFNFISIKYFMLLQSHVCTYHPWSSIAISEAVRACRFCTDQCKCIISFSKRMTVNIDVIFPILLFLPYFPSFLTSFHPSFLSSFLSYFLSFFLCSFLTSYLINMMVINFEEK